MSEIVLKQNQAALILDVSPEGEVSVNAAFPKENDEAGNLAADICTVIGKMLSEEEEFQAQVMAALEG
ncbi:MAG: hypothetical protein KQH63_04785 [Desulfobulbaceae bacterium]|nr:hypothetical protein [Desulfobulbaceae bacterium]